MGESIVEVPNAENKTRESLDSGVALEASVSFGRFENDSLSWEKWSTFSPNKYLEEVEKCSTPGSVAQKKAYFEAHYKNIAARKAQLDQEKKMEINHLKTQEQNSEDHVGDVSGAEIEPCIDDALNSPETVGQVTHSVGVMSCSLSDESNENAAISIECQSPSVDGPKEGSDSIPDSLELNKSEEAVLVQEGTHRYGFEVRMTQMPVLVPKPEDKLELRMDLGETGNSLENKKKNPNLGGLNKSQKVGPSKNEGNLARAKKKPISPLVKKSSQFSTPKTSKTMSTSPVMSTSRSSARKGNGSSLPSSKTPPVRESKKVVHPSVHMSLNFDAANSESSSLTTTRKSIIMEKMGDKDIVKRVFKTFQNNFNQERSSAHEISSAQKEVSTTVPEQKMSNPSTPQKENEGIRRGTEKKDAQRGHLGRNWNSPSSGSLKGAGMDQRKSKPAPSLNLRNEEGTVTQKIFKKREEKSYSKEAQKPQLNSKLKDGKQSEIRKLRQSPSIKAASMPSSYPGHVLSKGPLDKEGVKNRRPQR
ncbi:protein WVD2-like 7 [Diospyros lotus]|uniref:protein WVD2-like 7 n=1 Tax=Diospyros lotus TaxID=55363 RepID=UPI00224C817A|nr:protein WVD2-like 7 [Diospyros lotus]XP_052187465.1 protein WVD2-like 7 [Diospyros lotus]XP_052187466.1 protein WVD2-like 7 [Diospyros lotus]XP_052187467.1 protein WVD2-like 7 [Diospyros lotus]